MEILIAVAGLAIGVLLGFFAGKIKFSKIESQVAVLKSRLEDQQRSHELRLAEQRRSYESQLADRQRVYAESMALQQSHERESLQAMQQRFDETVRRMKAEMESVTSEMLKSRQSEFEASSRKGVAQLLEPLNETIKRMNEAVRENTLRHTEFGGTLNSNIRLVLEHSDAARKSADRLADALRGGGRIQGDWGETVLTELLESQGLRETVHFDTQVVLHDASGIPVKGDDGKVLKPDVILHLDNRRDVVIDAKVSLSAYLDYMNAETEELRSKALKDHVASVENHVNELVRKRYDKYIKPEKEKIDYVIMFVPNTAALYAAVTAKPDLWRKAMERGVYIADEQTLYAALRIINMTWRQIAQAENHEKVFALANEMLDRVSMFMEKFTKVGKQLEDAKSAYDGALGKLRESGASIPQTCRKLVELGASAKPRRGVDPAMVGMAPDKSLSEYPVGEEG